MEIGNPFIIFLTLFISVVFLLRRLRRSSLPLPPSPLSLPFFGNLIWLHTRFSELETVLRKLRLKYGPILTVKIGSLRIVLVSDRHVTHKMLVQGGTDFAGRPPVGPALSLLSGNQFTINGLSYGPHWRALRRNLSSEILNPATIRVFAPARRWVLADLLQKLKLHAHCGRLITLVPIFQNAMFSLLAFMCFGDKLDEKTVMEIEAIQREILLYVEKLTVFAFLPKYGKFLLYNRWKKIKELRARQKQVFLPLIRSRREKREKTFEICYLDTLFEVQVPKEEGSRKLEDDEIISLCSEFINGGTDTTVTSLEWIMACLVNNSEVQRKLAKGMKEYTVIEEEELGKMSYLRAVVMEGLRRHPPGHFLLSHAAMEETDVEGYKIPKGWAVNFMVTEMNWSDELWREPLEFRPERFLEGGEGESVDLTGTKEIKMLTFGAGRRICPGLGLAMLHLGFFIGNLIKEFEWAPPEGEEVDMREKVQFTVSMKSPLKARLFPRS
ncbi:cytochrome P450 89A2-like [Wolffia australiana]